MRCLRALTRLVLLVFPWCLPATHGQNVPGLLAGLQSKPVQVTDNIHYAPGFGNTFLVTTTEGNVVIDTSLAAMAGRAKQQLQKISDAPVHSIILTHGHSDHTGGVRLWKEEGTEVIAQRNFVAFAEYQQRLAPFFAARNAAQFGLSSNAADVERASRQQLAQAEPTILFDDRYEFELGGISFVCLSMPGETYDHLAVWLPQSKAAFVGDNFYASFPNIYTLRGTKPRWALDYVASINRILELEPEILLPSHGAPIQGKDKITTALMRYRDAVQYVHDATVEGMNQGKDVYTLMREIELPAELDLGELYGKVSWSVRGIYEGYVGWFDGNPATMYQIPPSDTYPDLVELAGGADRIAQRAAELLEGGEPIRALHLSEVALSAGTKNQRALKVQIAALKVAREKSRNFLERSWLGHGIRTATAELSER